TLRVWIVEGTALVYIAGQIFQADIPDHANYRQELRHVSFRSGIGGGERQIDPPANWITIRPESCCQPPRDHYYSAARLGISFVEVTAPHQRDLHGLEVAGCDRHPHRTGTNGITSRFRLFGHRGTNRASAVERHRAGDSNVRHSGHRTRRIERPCHETS